MFALSPVVPAITSALTLPLVLTVAIATVALVGIAVFVRRARRAGSLTGLLALASGVSAAGILVSALVVTLIVGGASAASADSTAPAVTTVSGSSVSNSVASPVAVPDGYQLETK